MKETKFINFYAKPWFMVLHVRDLDEGFFRIGYNPNNGKRTVLVHAAKWIGPGWRIGQPRKSDGKFFGRRIPAGKNGENAIAKLIKSGYRHEGDRII